MPIRYRTLTLIAFAVLYGLLSLYALGRFAIASNMGDSWRGASLAGMVEGTAERPYVYRILVPQMVAAVVRITPSGVQNAVGQALLPLQDNEIAAAFIKEKPLLRMVFEQPDLLYMRAVAGIVIYLCLAGYMVALYRLGRVLFPQEWTMALVAPVVGILMALAMSYPTLYIYDAAVLFLSAACYYCLAGGQWRWYYAWFILACLNKETSVFLLLFFTLWYFPRLSLNRFLLHWGAQFVLFVAIRGAVYQVFAGNPGEFLKTDYFSWHMITLFSGYDYLILVATFITAFLLTYRWQEKPLFVRYGLAIFAMLAAAFLMFGRPGEYRVFYDIVPLLALLVTHTLVAGTGLTIALRGDGKT